MVFDFFQKAGDDFGAFLEKKAKEDAEALAKFTSGLEKSRDAFAANLEGIFGGAASKTLEETLDALEDALMSADIGFQTTTTILGALVMAARVALVKAGRRQPARLRVATKLAGKRARMAEMWPWTCNRRKRWEGLRAGDLSWDPSRLQS